jgi:radical SAM superfamily enzyme YgiQ (UPF0313 family)
VQGSVTLDPAPSVLVVSCYELGHQPVTLASLVARLGADGVDVRALDSSVEEIDDVELARAKLVVISVPMHTALRLGAELALRARRINPAVHVCMFGLYAWLNGAELLAVCADSIVGGQYEEPIAEICRRLCTNRRDFEGIAGLTTRDGYRVRGFIAPPLLTRTPLSVPDRHALPSLTKYAMLLGPCENQRRIVGYVEASRGCKYRCRHCPVVPVFDGRFFVIPAELVLADVRQQVAMGAEHITFGDPDFMNGIGHALQIARALHAEHPELSFDITVKIEHIVRYRAHFPELGKLGCLFIVSAVESFSDRVLSELDKGHSRADIFEAFRILADAGIHLRPSFVAFTPWTTLDDYIELIEIVFEHDLVENVDPIQLAIRLLVPRGSALLWPPELLNPRRQAGLATRGGPVTAPSGATFTAAYDAAMFGYRWAHPDPRMDALYEAVSRQVEQAARQAHGNHETLSAIRALAHAAAGREPKALAESRRRFVPRLTESWFCCAEPSREQFERVVEPCRVERRA